MNQDNHQSNQSSLDNQMPRQNYQQGQKQQFSNEVFSWEVYAGKNRTYFYNLKEDKNNELYMTIKEVKYSSDGFKEVHRIIIFEKDFANFQQGFNNSVSFIKGRSPQAFVPRSRKNFEDAKNQNLKQGNNQNQNQNSYQNSDQPISKISEQSKDPEPNSTRNSKHTVTANSFADSDDILELN